MLKLKPENIDFLRKLVIDMIMLVCLAIVLALGFNRCRGPETRVALMDSGVLTAETVSDDMLMQELPGLNPITPELAYAKMQAKSLVFVDSRHPIEYAKGHIKDAVNVPNEFMVDYLDGFLNDYPPETILVVYCDGKNCDQARQLGEELVFAGYTVVYYLEPSWLAWLNSGKPVTINY